MQRDQQLAARAVRKRDVLQLCQRAQLGQLRHVCAVELQCAHIQTAAEPGQVRDGVAVGQQRRELRQLLDARQTREPVGADVEHLHTAGGQAPERGQRLKFKRELAQARKIREVGQLADVSALHGDALSGRVDDLRRLDAGSRRIHALLRGGKPVPVAADVQRREALEVRDRELALGLSGIFARGPLKQGVLECGHRVVRQCLHRDGPGREAVEQAREVADDARRDQAADEHDRDDRRRDAALFLRALRLRRFGGPFPALLFSARGFLFLLFRPRRPGGRLGRQLRRFARKSVRIEQLGREELVVEIFLARVGIFHEREEVSDLHLHARGELRLLEVDVDDRLFLRQGIVHLLAAVVGLQICRGQKRQHELRALEVRRNALRPLAAGLDALVIPDAKAARLQRADDPEHGRVVLVRVADEDVRLCALVGAQKCSQKTTSGKKSKNDWILLVYHTHPRSARALTPASQAYGTHRSPRPEPRAMSGLRRP